MEAISRYKRVHLAGKSWRIRIVETNGENVQLNESEYVISEFHDESPPFVSIPPNSPLNEGTVHDRHLKKGDISPHSPSEERAHQNGSKPPDVPSPSKEPSSQSVVNPLKPKSSPLVINTGENLSVQGPVSIHEVSGDSQQKLHTSIAIQTSIPIEKAIKDKSNMNTQTEQVLHLNTTNWIPRERGSPSTLIGHISDHDIPSLDEEEQGSLDSEHEANQSSILKELEKLRIKS